MDSSFKRDLAKLRLYLEHLPDAIPLPLPGQLAYDFTFFAPDPEWTLDIGEEHAVNQQLEAILGSRAKGPILLKEQGPGITALPDVLDRYLISYPTLVILQKWLSDMIDSAKFIYEYYQTKVNIRPKRKHSVGEPSWLPDDAAASSVAVENP
jgi:hypothetical protein